MLASLRRWQRARDIGLDFAGYIAALVRNDLLRPHANLVLLSGKQAERKNIDKRK